MYFAQTACFLLLTLSGATQSANILGYFSVGSVSHQIVFQPIWKELSLRGHKVTVVTPNPLNDPTLTNLTEIDLSVSYDHFKAMIAKDFTGAMDHWKFEKWLHSIVLKMNDVQFRHPQVQALLEDKNKTFDVLLTEPWIPFPAAFR